MKTEHGAEVFQAKTDSVKVSATRFGGLVTATFQLGEREVSPYALAPWQPDDLDPEMPTVIKNLRGDFFCLPFGPQPDGPPHGETCNGEWHDISGKETGLLLEMNATDVQAKIQKRIGLRPDETALYLEHRLEGLTGNFPYGSHPVLDFSGIEGQVSVSPFRWASVNRGLFSNPENREYQALKPGANFTDLRQVPKIDGETADLTHYPARKGFEDLVMMASDQSGPFAWSACVMDGYLWFCLKNPQVFPATLFWISNGGRHSEPWNGKHFARLGIEEVCSHFADGLETSRQDLLASEGIPTTRKFDGSPTLLRLIQAVAKIPHNFDLVQKITPNGPNQITLHAESGATTQAKIDWEWLTP